MFGLVDWTWWVGYLIPWVIGFICGWRLRKVAIREEQWEIQEARRRHPAYRGQDGWIR